MRRAFALLFRPLALVAIAVALVSAVTFSCSQNPTNVPIRTFDASCTSFRRLTSAASSGAGAAWSVPYMASTGSWPNQGRAPSMKRSVADASRSGTANKPAALP